MIFLKCESIVIVSNNVVLNGIVPSSSMSYFGSESLCIQRRPQIVLIVNEEGLPVKGNRKKKHQIVFDGFFKQTEQQVT